MALKKITTDLPAVQGVAAGSKATLRLPLGPTYHQVLLAYSGATLAQLNGLRLLINGEVAWSITGLAKLDDINQFDGRAAANGTIIIDFERFGIRDRILQEMTALGTGVRDGSDPRPITNLFLEIDIDAAAVNPVLSAKRVVSAASPSGVVLKVLEFSKNSSGAGVMEISDLPLGTGRINRIFIGNDGVLGITKLVIKRDNNIIFDRSKADNEQVQIDGVRVPQADYVVFDPSEDGFGDESISTSEIQDLRIELTVAAAGSVPVTVEYLSAVTNIG